MNYELLQSEIVTRLQPFNTVGVSTVRLPESNTEKTQVPLDKAKFTVIYAGSEYGGPKATGYFSQDEKVFVQVLIESALLYGTMGIYNLTSVLKSALIGFKPTGLTKGLEVSKHHSIGSPEIEQKDNIWRYQVVFQSEAMSVEVFEEDISILIKKITVNDGPQDSIEIPNPDNPTT